VFATCFGDQAEEQRPSIQTAPEIIQIGTIREGHWPPALPERRAQALRCIPSGLISVQHTKDDFGACEPAESVQGEIRPAGTEGGEPPAHRRQPIKRTFDQVDPSPPDRSLETKDWLVTGWCQVLDSTGVTGAATDKPDGLPAPDLGNDNSPSESFAQWASSFARLTAEQAQILGDSQAAVLAQMSL
jgi:hypothetical protein